MTDIQTTTEEPTPSEIAVMTRYADDVVLTWLDRDEAESNVPYGWFVVAQFPGEPITQDAYGLNYQAALEDFVRIARA